MLILTNVVPRVDRKYSTTGKIGSGTNSEPDSLRLPIKTVSFFGGSDDIDISRAFSGRIVSKDRSALPHSHSAPQDLSVGEFVDRFEL